MEDNSFLEAPRIVVIPPGPKSLEMLKFQEEMETVAVNYPRYFPFAIKEARGSTIMDVDGNIYIDWVAGISVVNLGHNNPIIREAVMSQLNKVWHSLEIPSEIRIEFMKVLRSTLNFDAKVLFTTTGADACEASVKIARWVTGKKLIVTFEGSYHGITSGTLGLTFSPVYKRYNPVYDRDIIRVPYPYEFRSPFKDCLNDVLSLVEHIVKMNSDVAGILVEPVLGEGGYVVPPSGFLRGLREIADNYGNLLIVDEIQSGMGRTGKIWAYEWENIVPDLVCISKSIGEGIPVSMVAFRRDLDKLPQAFHLGTYRGNPLGLAAGKATLDILKSSDILDRVISLGDYVLRRFKEINENVANGRFDVRGKGFMIGFEMVRDKKEPWEDGVKKMINGMFKRGLLMYKAGIYSNVLRFMAPLTIPKKLLDSGLVIFEDTLKEIITKEVMEKKL
ncbi:MAG: aspartate aminotransferase family protein [Thermoprotei archaeon]|jgi:4-aminobutyrate aminotransferase-like enzyme